MIKRIISVCLTVAALFIIIATPVLAVDNVLVFTATTTDTTISFRINLPTGATSSVVRYSTTAYPPTRADGTGVTMTNKYYATITDLTAGTTYYFSTWGWDEAAAYSATAYNYIVTLPPASSTEIETPAIPDLPGGINDAPDVSGLDVYPFNLIIDNLNSAPGGLGIPTTTSWEFVVNALAVIIAIFAYIKTKSLFVASVAAIIISYASWQAGLTQLYGLVVLIIVALGIWAMEASFNRS